MMHASCRLTTTALFHDMKPTTHTITIDGQDISFTVGQTIMDAALAANVYIPHLCHYPGLTPHGNCKLCTINIDNHSVAACTTPATNGQQISNNTPALNATRKTLTQMLFIEGNHICPSCEKTGNCKLQAMGYHLDMRDERFSQFYQHREMDASHPTILLDRGRCILCDLCVRASRDVDGKNVFAIAGRGVNAHLIVNSSSGKLVDSDIESSDLAANICPVGAILIKEQGYKVPIGQRIYDQHTIDEVSFTEKLNSTTHDDD